MMIYRELFGFSVRNTFYRNEKYPSELIYQEDFEVRPAPSTQDFLRDTGLVFRKNQNGFKLWGKVVRLTPSLMALARKIDPATRLTFLVTLINQDIQGFSEVAVKELNGGFVYYGHNRGSHADPRNDLRMSTQPTVNATDDLLRTQPAAYSFLAPGLLPSTAAKVVALDGPEIVLPLSTTQANATTTFSFSLGAAPLGRYQLEVSGVVQDTFYYIGNQQNVFGVIEIFFSGTAANYQILEPDNSLTSDRPQYLLRLQGRKTFWRYTVNMIRNPLAAPAVAISDGSALFTLSSSSPTQAVFTSDVHFDSQEDPLLRGSPPNLVKINLKDGVNEKIEQLPLPNLALLKEESNLYYSDITINI
ncbi:hypothetical protein CLV98_107174 [Dyadobacter jejuensis]|uniref:Uncharacterized protein n=1 Tax=Dyadobacter jejuensis TaxID=1082580 RepID=A0A316AID6_9BACT|nr:hypothetical protein [Dyadobacter jejuensis]PWJ57466.1 hypothetical protein CLV98_107174 [Dyadobacter jejuensis]